MHLKKFQTLLFLHEQSLQGFRRACYVLIKILKFCTGSSAKSYQCKAALEDALKGKVVEAGEAGSVLREVIHHFTLRGKFSSVHPELKQEGIVRVEVGEAGLRFVRDKGDILIITNVSLN